MTAYPGCARLARSLIVLTEHISSLCNNWRASEASETLSRVYKFELVRYTYIFITYARKMDQSDRSVGVDCISIFHPNNPPLVLGMLVGCVATDTSRSN